MLVGPRRSNAGLLVAHDYRPGTNLPLLCDAILDVRIVAREVFGGSRIGRVEDKERARRRIGESACQNQFAARIRFARQAKVFFAIRAAPSDEIINHVVHQREIWHWNSSRCGDSSLARREGVEPGLLQGSSGKLGCRNYSDPPAMEGTRRTRSPSLRQQDSPPRKRMSSSLR